METKHIPFEEVYDLYAMRIIFDCDDPAREKAICWEIYSAITDLYRLHPDRTRDWISVPKANGYQALHLTVMGPDGNWVEVQIRSRRMDEIAEKGFAAHWKYKLGESDEESELDMVTALASDTVGRTLFLWHTANRHRSDKAASCKLMFIVQSNQLRNGKFLRAVAGAVVTGRTGQPSFSGLLICTLYQSVKFFFA